MHPETGAMLATWYPGAMVWRGEHTRRWWAYHPALPYLVEGRDLADVAGRLGTVLGRAGRLDDTLVDGFPPYDDTSSGVEG